KFTCAPAGSQYGVVVDVAADDRGIRHRVHCQAIHRHQSPLPAAERLARYERPFAAIPLSLAGLWVD
ncbi:MAG: hypothetical protein ACYC1J_10300, partial [Acidithiobacillus ferrooxidans]